MGRGRDTGLVSTHVLGMRGLSACNWAGLGKPGPDVGSQGSCCFSNNMVWSFQNHLLKPDHLLHHIGQPQGQFLTQAPSGCQAQVSQRQGLGAQLGH